MLDLTHLRSFAEVAERGTVAASAASQGYTPPAVSQHIGKLERALGARLFDRQRGRLTLTGPGRALLPVALELLDAERRARQAVLSPAHRPRVVVAGFASAIAQLVVPCLVAMQDSAAVEVLELEDDAAMRELRLGSVDIVLSQEYDGVATARDDRFRYMPVLTDVLRLVVPPTVSAATTLDQVDGAAWLVNGRHTRCGQATRAILERHGIRHQVSADVADNETLLSLVAAGHGVTIAPHLVAAARPDVTITSQDLRTRRTIFAVVRHDTSPARDKLVDLLADLQP